MSFGGNCSLSLEIRGTFNDERKSGHLSKGLRTLLENKRSSCTKKGYLSEVKMGHFLHLKKEAGAPRMKRDFYENGKWAFVDGKEAPIRF